MADFYEKRKLKKILYSKSFLVFLCVPALLMVYAAYSTHGKMQDAVERRAELSATLAELEERAGELEEDIEKLEDPHGIEAELRRRYEVAKEGEKVIVFVEEDIPTSSEEEQEEEKGIWDRWFGD